MTGAKLEFYIRNIEWKKFPLSNVVQGLHYSPLIQISLFTSKSSRLVKRVDLLKINEKYDELRWPGTFLFWVNTVKMFG